jgi:hypothetical protein
MKNSACLSRMIGLLTFHSQILLNLQEQMRRIVRAIDAIPLHLTLDIIRLDDALGETWGLPFQACTQWDVRQPC